MVNGSIKNKNEYLAKVIRNSNIPNDVNGCFQNSVCYQRRILSSNGNLPGENCGSIDSATRYRLFWIGNIPSQNVGKFL